MNWQPKITKLILALKQKGRIILITSEQFYSNKSQSTCTKFILTEGTPRKKELNSEIKSLKEKLKDKNINNKEEIENKINECKKEIELNFIEKTEIFGKLNVVLFLANLYKKVGGKNG